MGERLFSAVALPATVSDELSRWVDPRRDGAWRWTDESDWHVTLAFYAEVETWRYDDLVAGLVTAARRTAPFPLGLRGVGCFRSAAHASVLYADVVDPADSMPRLAARCHVAATTVGVEVPRQTYHPHVTLARRNQPSDGTRQLRALSELFTSPWEVTDFVLIQSFLGEGPRGTPRYVVRERVPLAGCDMTATAHGGEE